MLASSAPCRARLRPAAPSVSVAVLAVFVATFALAPSAFAGSGDGLEVANSARCDVALTKLSYDTPGADAAEFIELHVDVAAARELDASTNAHQHQSAARPVFDGGARDAGNALTLGACGLSEIHLVDGTNAACATYRTIPVADVPVPEDGFVLFCAAGSELDLAERCDVTTAGRSGLKNGWLQNGPSDGVSFIGDLGNAAVDIEYEGAPACFPKSALELVTESGQISGSAVPSDDVNVFCGDRFVLLGADGAPLRRANQCPALPNSGDAGGSSTWSSADGNAPTDDSERAPSANPGSSGEGASPFETTHLDAGLVAVPKKISTVPKPPGCSLVSLAGERTRGCGSPWAVVAMMVAQLTVVRRRRRRLGVPAALRALRVGSSARCGSPRLR